VAALRRRKRRNHPPAAARLAARAAVSHRDKVRAQQRAGASAGAETRAHVRADVSLTYTVYSIVLNGTCFFPPFFVSFAGLWSFAGVRWWLEGRPDKLGWAGLGGLKSGWVVTAAWEVLGVLVIPSD
jgi:hypothetical protein